MRDKLLMMALGFFLFSAAAIQPAQAGLFDDITSGFSNAFNNIIGGARDFTCSTFGAFCDAPKASNVPSTRVVGCDSRIASCSGGSGGGCDPSITSCSGGGGSVFDGEPVPQPRIPVPCVCHWWDVGIQEVTMFNPLKDVSTTGGLDANLFYSGLPLSGTAKIANNGNLVTGGNPSDSSVAQKVLVQLEFEIDGVKQDDWTLQGEFSINSGGVWEYFFTVPTIPTGVTDVKNYVIEKHELKVTAFMPTPSGDPRLGGSFTNACNGDSPICTGDCGFYPVRTCSLTAKTFDTIITLHPVPPSLSFGTVLDIVKQHLSSSVLGG